MSEKNKANREWFNDDTMRDKRFLDIKGLGNHKYLLNPKLGIL